MPYKKQEKQFGEVERLLLGYRLNTQKLSLVLGCSPPTARKKLTNPGTLTLMDIERIVRFGHVPIDEVRNAIKV